MKSCFVSFASNEKIPVSRHLTNRKLRKYFNRETSVAIVCSSMLLKDENVPSDTPFYYAAGLLSFEEYGLAKLINSSLTDEGEFSQQRFIDIGVMGISPLTSFKFLPNMTLAFISIEQKLTGDNAVVYVSADSLLNYARVAPTTGPILIGAGQVDSEGNAASCFALVAKEELILLSPQKPDMQALALLRSLSPEKAL